MKPRPRAARGALLVLIALAISAFGACGELLNVDGIQIEVGSAGSGGGPSDCEPGSFRCEGPALQLCEPTRELRTVHNFRGYIHLKTIPEASAQLVEEAGLYADRLSINIEMPTDAGLGQYAPEKRPAGIRRAMGDLRLKIEAASEPTARKAERTSRRERTRRSPLPPPPATAFSMQG